MEIKVFSGKLDTQKVDVLFIPVFLEDKRLSEEAKKLDEKLEGAISKLKKEQKFKGKLGKTLIVPTLDKIKSKFIILIGAGSKKKADLDIFRRIAATAVKTAKSINANKILFDIKGLDIKEKEEDIAQSVVEGVILGSYTFDKYKSKKDNFKIKTLNIRTSRKSKNNAEKSVEVGRILAESQNFTRELVNTPPNVINPEKLAEIALDLGKEYGFEVKIYDEEECEKMGMGAYLAVAKGSANPPRF
ncbi:MAG: aminopeptidase, partial [Aquificota bacterium]